MLTADVAAAGGAAIHFLVSRQDERGRWKDYDEVGGGSDEWVPAYVAAHLAALTDSRARAAARKGWEALRRRSWWSSGWGYMQGHPADADSTTWALRLAELLQVRPSIRILRGYRFIGSHQRGNGGIATFAIPGPMKLYTGLTSRFDGWCAPHECVSAATAALRRFPGRRGALEFLRSRQRSDGGWLGYWWYDREYATALSVEALARTGRSDDLVRIAAASEWALRRATPEGFVISDAAPCGSCFATAMRLRILRQAPNQEEVRAATERSAEWLCRMQNPDGSWPGSAWLRFPPTAMADPEDRSSWHIGQLVEGGVMVDRRGLLTTATVLTALERIKELHHDRSISDVSSLSPG